MTRPGFGARVRIVTAPETVVDGFAGRAGEVWAESDAGLSVFFEDTEELAWFPPHLVKRADRGARARLPVLVCVVAVALAAATAFAAAGRSDVSSLTVVSAATPCLPVPGYLTAGAYPVVLGGSRRAARTNIALRRAVVSDQHRYAPAARRHAAPDAAGVYETAIDPGLTSASTVVVSALIPALELYPGSHEGQTWIATTVEVRSGRLVSLRDLLANAQLALPALVKDWKASLRRTPSWGFVVQDPARYTATLAHYRRFALTPSGLAFGFPQEPAGSRFAAVVPYRLVRPYLSRLGRRLVAGVRRPGRPRTQGQGELAWASLQGSPPALARRWPLACT